MKKVIIIAIIALFAIGQTDAQVSFKPGVRGGLNFSHFTQGNYSNSSHYYDNNGNYISTNNENFTSKTDFYLGIYGALRLTKYYTLQPEINYSRQGSNYEYVNSNTNMITKTRIDVNYLSLSIINKFTFNEKFNFHLGPIIDIIVDKPRRTNSNDYIESDIDLSFTAGLGYNFTKNFGIDARIKKGIVPVFYNSGTDHENVVFQVGATYTFDVK